MIYRIVTSLTCRKKIDEDIIIEGREHNTKKHNIVKVQEMKLCKWNTVIKQAMRVTSMSVEEKVLTKSVIRICKHINFICKCAGFLN